MKTHPAVKNLSVELSAILNDVASKFTGTPKITLVVRTPQVEDGGVLMTNESNIQLALDEIIRLSKKQGF